jgi:hypothetical protein
MAWFKGDTHWHWGIAEGPFHPAVRAIAGATTGCGLRLAGKPQASFDKTLPPCAECVEVQKRELVRLELIRLEDERLAEEARLEAERLAEEAEMLAEKARVEAERLAEEADEVPPSQADTVPEFEGP